MEKKLQVYPDTVPRFLRVRLTNNGEGSLSVSDASQRRNLVPGASEATRKLLQNHTLGAKKV